MNLIRTSLRASRVVAVAVFASAFGTGCLGTAFDNEEPNTPQPNAGPTNPSYAQPPAAAPVPQTYPAELPPQQPQAPIAYPGPAQAPAGQPPYAAPMPAGPQITNAYDPINVLDENWMRRQASSVLVELINALPPAQKGRVHDIPLNADPTVGEVNAFAACENGQPLMAISDGLLQIEAYSAQFRATDEIFGTHKLDQYLSYVAKNQQPHQPIVQPPAGFIDPMQHNDQRKIARQHVLFDEQLAFVLGHELGHHYLGHTGCANGQGGILAGAATIVRIAQKVAPPLNQVNETAADIAGTNNLLAAGAHRQGTHWNEEGALLTLDFFEHFEGLSPTARVLVTFISSHPSPAFRRPVIQQAAASWRAGWALPSGIPGLFGG